MLRAPARLPRPSFLLRRGWRTATWPAECRPKSTCLGVHAVQNTVDKEPCRLGAGYAAYPSDVVKARYGAPADYAKRISASAAALVARRLLLAEDAEPIVRAAQAVRWDH